MLHSVENRWMEFLRSTGVKLSAVHGNECAKAC